MKILLIIVFFLSTSCAFFSIKKTSSKNSNKLNLEKKDTSLKPNYFLKQQKKLFLSAKTSFQEKNFKSALSDIKDLLHEKEHLPKEMLIKIYQLKLAVFLRSPDTKKIKLLEAYCNILQYTTQRKSIYRKQVFDIISNMKKQTLKKIKDEEYIDPIKDLVFYQMGKVLFYEEKFKISSNFFKKFLLFSIDDQLEAKALKYLQAIESLKTANKKHIGAIIPLSGPAKKIGAKILKGLQIGLGIYTNKESSFKLIILDSQGQLDKAKKAVEKLVIKHHVIAIVGGALSRTANVIAEEAQNFGVPAVLISQKSKLTAAGRYVFQNSLTSSLIARQLTKFLTNKFKIKTFAILYPNDSYGVDYANAFWTAVEKQGGKVVGVQTYKPGETDFNGPVKRLTGLYYKKARLKEYKEKLKNIYLTTPALLKGRPAAVDNILAPITGFEVLFIPDSIKVLNSIASHLTYNDIKNIHLAGPSIWNQPLSIKKNSRYIKSAFFADTWLTAKKFQKTDFYTQFLHIFKTKPGLFELLAYESTLILRQSIIGGADSRSELRKTLQSRKKFYGPLGELFINEKREFVRPLQIYKIENHSIKPIKQDF